MKTREEKKPENHAQSLLIARLRAEVSHPADIDAATERLGISPSLINPYLATTVDLSFLGLEDGVNLPVQISRREGGRSSLYFLQPGQKVLASIVASSQGILLRHVSRETGNSVPAQAGDEYSEEFRDLAGEVLLHRRGQLEVLDTEKGTGRLIFTKGTDEAASSWWWILWSCIAGGKDRKISL